ncbi:NAD(P)/FAD-dependent oxidoreductase [Pelagimonas varians]|uniref:Gamma-glutamylputrescine oxidoreductase n=1 Tax=Pelagimonas varians TaxID=696760 RepID=A0A238KVR1_9RHOB|nr:FAD-binding oxidoreductase [Pelagimonas varians]PYG28109.1 glycine/D-amino acid oxidase-like deaminating enzyme [Pelagimonas varians]SMX46711.1 Gamma-glutamylputrescine oxidoreductase [Pelagimonas varians]
MKVTRLPKDPGPAAWNRLLSDADPATPLEGNITADWLIIGAGFAGLAAAHRLSKQAPGDRIVVLDAVRIGDGPAGRNSGFMIDLPHDLTSADYGGALVTDRAQTQDNRLGIAHAREMAQDYGLSEEAFIISGKINGAATAKGHAHNLSFGKHLTALGEPYDMLDAAQMRNITGSDYYQSGLFTPGCAMIQPAMFVRGVASGLRSNRVFIHEMSPVISLERKTDWIAKTPKGRVTAPRVILAVNGHLNSFGYLPNRLMHVFTYASMTRALSAQESVSLGGNPAWGLTPADPMGTTVRRVSGTGGDRIIIRNRFTFDPSMEVSDKRIAKVARDHDRAFAARFPMLAHTSMDFRWGGRLCVSRNNVQVIGELDERLYSACCQNGLGTAKGTLAGGLVADLALGRSSDALSRALAADLPSRLPPAPLSSIGANLFLKWQERQAGGEL